MKYKANSNFFFNGKAVERGQLLTLTESEARLISFRVELDEEKAIEEPVKAKKDKK